MGSYLLSVKLAGYIYDRQVASIQAAALAAGQVLTGTQRCVGPQCFRWVFPCWFLLLWRRKVLLPGFTYFSGTSLTRKCILLSLSLPHLVYCLMISGVSGTNPLYLSPPYFTYSLRAQMTKEVWMVDVPTWHERDNFSWSTKWWVTKPGDHDTSKSYNPCLYRRAHINRMVMK